MKEKKCLDFHNDNCLEILCVWMLQTAITKPKKSY